MNYTARVIGRCVAIAGLVFGVSCATVEPLDGATLLGFDSGMHHAAAGGDPNTGAGGMPPDNGAGGDPLPPPGPGGMLGMGGMVIMEGKGGTAAGGRMNVAGSPGAGGRMMGAGGRSGTGGMMTTGAGGGPPQCASNEKICGGVCAAPSPKVGCGMTGCDPCSMTAPMNGYLTCNNGQCGFDCLSGYMKMGDKCEGPPPGSTGGNCPTSAVGCPDCGPVFGPGCCAQSKCGCSPIPWTVGILGCV